MYLLISFRPAREDYCMGCFMSGTNAVYDLRRFEDEETLAAALAADAITNKLAERDTGQIGHTIIRHDKVMYDDIGNDSYPDVYDVLSEEDDAAMEALWSRVNVIKEQGLDAYSRQRAREAEAAREKSEAEAKRRAAFDADVAQLKLKHNIS